MVNIRYLVRFLMYSEFVDRKLKLQQKFIRRFRAAGKAMSQCQKSNNVKYQKELMYVVM